MKTIAVIDAGEAQLAFYRTFFERLRAETAAERLFVLMDGDLARAGGLAATDKRRRADKLRRAGADAVIQMPLPAQMLVDNLYAFAAEAMLRKLGCVDLLALPLAGADRDLFVRAADLLFDEPAPYRARMRALREGGADLDAALPGAAEACLPGAGAFFSHPQNRMAAEYRNALRRAYSTVGVHPLELPLPPEAREKSAPARDAHVLRRAAQAFSARDARATREWAANQFSGSARMAGRLADLLAAGTCQSLEDFGAAAACADMNAAAARRYLMSCLVGYRKVDGFVCITYNYIPYIRVLAATDAALDALKRSAGTTLFRDGDAGEAQVKDVYKRLLLDMERRARALFVESGA